MAILKMIFEAVVLVSFLFVLYVWLVVLAV